MDLMSYEISKISNSNDKDVNISLKKSIIA